MGHLITWVWWLAGAVVLAGLGRIWYRREQARRARETVDNALKFLYTMERSHLRATPEELALRLRLSRRALSRLIQTLADHGFARMSHRAIELTPAGKAVGLHLLRAHRLWERHLADNTGVALNQIHRLAEKKEHTMSKDEVRALEARLGFPGSDPHGDVIPDEAGATRTEDVPIVPLTDWPLGVQGRIAHIEDEPEELFTQVLSLGLLPGAKIVVQESSPRGIRVLVDDQDVWLAPILATQVEVGHPEPEEESKTGVRLSDLNPGETARVISLSREVRGLERRRLLDLGFTRGALVQPVLRSSFGRGDPTAYRIRGTLIALRRDQAAQIFVEKIDPGHIPTDVTL